MTTRLVQRRLLCPVCNRGARADLRDHFIEEQSAPVSRTLERFECDGGHQLTPEQEAAITRLPGD